MNELNLCIILKEINLGIDLFKVIGLFFDIIGLFYLDYLLICNKI